MRNRHTYSQRPNRAARVAHARGDREFRTYDTSLIRPKRSPVPRILGLVFAVCLLALLIFGVVTLVNSCSTPEVELRPSGEQVELTIDAGSGAQDIANQLVDERLIPSAPDFVTRVRDLNADDQLKPGNYSLTSGTSVDDLIAQLQKGPNDDIVISVPEGYTLKKIAKAVADASDKRITEKDFLKATSDASKYAKDYPFLKEAKKNKLEGFLFPKTYTVVKDATADDIVREMLDQYKEETDALDYSYPKKAGLNQYQALILASIVEKEAAPENRSTVASVLYNRLTTEGEPSHGLLQSDATTAYEVGRNPTAEDIAKDSAYNTYTNKGLPPTPICSPSIESLKAVCSPEKTDYYFFYFEPDDKGKIQYHFSKTYEEHKKTYE